VYSTTIAGTPQSLAAIAADLAQQLNDDNVNASRYTALVDGTRITIVDREGGSFETRLDAGNISRYEGHADIQLAYTLDEAGMAKALRALYGFGVNDLK